MDQFLNRENLNRDERAILDIYLTGVVHALTGVNVVQETNNKPPLLTSCELDAAGLEDLLDAFLKERQDMKSQSLGICAVMAVMQRFGA